MSDPLSIDGLLDRAFCLASFLQGDRDAALNIVAGALAKLQVAVTAQAKRLYYRPAGRPWLQRPQSDRFRNHVYFNELHLLQRLIYIEAETYEVRQEQGKGPVPLSEENLVIHYIKHLIRMTVKRNSFYVALGLSRLLYSYSTAETMDIYNAVIQDPERVKDDYYYRSRKGVLMQELKERFGDLINICRGPRGEERFQADDNQSRFVELVRECLSFFTPWQTPCLVPPGIDPITEGIPSLSYQGHKKEDQIEVNRMHAVVHPDCFRRLIAALHFDDPDTRLEIPHFFQANDMNNNGLRSKRLNQPKLDEKELRAIKGELDNNAARRKAAQAGLLRIVVDRVEHATIDLRKTSSARFGLDKNAEAIEVWSRDIPGKELLLALHLVTHEGNEDTVQADNASITLEGRQKISIIVSRASGEPGATAQITYRETNPFRAASFFFHQLTHSLSGGPSGSIWKDGRIFVPALILLLIIGLGLLMKYARKGNERGIDEKLIAANQHNDQVDQAQSATRNSPRGNGGASTAEGTKIPKSSKGGPQQVAEARQQPEVLAAPPRTENGERTSERANPVPGPARETGTRSVTGVPAAVPLSAVKKVYIEVLGDDTLSQRVREMLNDKLRLSKRIILAQDRDQADGLLRVAVVKKSNADADLERPNVRVELINARGVVIWPNASSGGNYRGSPAEVSTSIARDLLAAIQSSPKRR